jgi:hypothetical protein
VIAYIFAATLCGVSFSLPKGWRADVAEPGGNVRCEIVLTPPRWDDVNEASAWGSHDSPATISMFKSSSIESALTGAGFERNDEGEWTLSTFRGFHAPASHLRVGAWGGIKAEGMYRGWAEDKTRLSSGQSSIYSATTLSVVLKKKRRVVGMTCESGPPSYQVDCDELVERVFRSLK